MEHENKMERYRRLKDRFFHEPITNYKKFFDNLKAEKSCFDHSYGQVLFSHLLEKNQFLEQLERFRKVKKYEPDMSADLWKTALLLETLKHSETALKH